MDHFYPIDRHRKLSLYRYRSLMKAFIPTCGSVFYNEQCLSLQKSDKGACNSYGHLQHFHLPIIRSPKFRFGCHFDFVWGT